MRKATFLFSLLLLGAAVVPPASATTVLPIQDSSLADQAVVIAEGTVISVGQSTDGRPVTEYRLRVEKQVKGEVPGGVATVRVLGGQAANGLKLKIWGAPELRIGERALLFLVPGKDGSFGVLHLTLGTFHELRSGKDRLAIRDLSEIYQVDAEGSPEPVRNLDLFTRWLADRAAGIERDADYLVPGQRGNQAWAAFTYLGGIKQRWLQFDHGQDVPWHANSGGQPQLDTGGFDEFAAALAAWTNDPSTNIRYIYAGTTDEDTGFDHPDDLNSILFNDVSTPDLPEGYAPGSFSCPRPGQGSGVLAVGGTWFDDSTSPAVIGEGDIVINDGSGCWFNNNGKRAEQVYGHELGHTLGLGHSCDGTAESCNTSAKNEALMRATAHSDNRGATLGSDDKAAILSLYPGGSGGSGNKPAAPSDLEGEAVSGTQIHLTWSDNSTNETQFLIEMKKGSKFKSVGTVKKNATEATIGGLASGKSYTFRVVAKKGKNRSDASNEVTVQTN
ncbi:MAG TPA: fibronectin type III domain-containing protein [Thermoanaerobaculia bacterium]|jgi:hypothetical protein|nr:fibronectin type III domain-containing protein [Thermoanaerobaculia bacterium]